MFIILIFGLESKKREVFIGRKPRYLAIGFTPSNVKAPASVNFIEQKLPLPGILHGKCR